MEYSLTSYRSLGHTCATAHRIAIETGDKTAAANLFALLWTHLDREDALDRWDCQSEFNHAFGRAYRGQTDTPAPASCVDKASVEARANARAQAARYPAIKAFDVAADCAAFYAKQPA